MALVKRVWLEDVVGKSQDLPIGYRVLGRNDVAAIEKEGAKFVGRSAYVFWADEGIVNLSVANSPNAKSLPRAAMTSASSGRCPRGETR